MCSLLEPLAGYGFGVDRGSHPMGESKLKHLQREEMLCGRGGSLGDRQCGHADGVTEVFILNAPPRGRAAATRPGTTATDNRRRSNAQVQRQPDHAVQLSA